DRYMLIIYGYFLVTTIGMTIKNIGLVYYCNYVLGTYNDGTTQMFLSAVGKAPLGFGVFILWPLVKKFGKRKVMIVGFLMAACAEGVCLINPSSMPVMLGGSLIYALGFLPSYVYTALMADTLDYIEYDKGIRADGLTASLFTIVNTVSVGIGQGIFNMGLSQSGYTAPHEVSEGVYNVQNAATQGFFSFAYIAIPLICLMVMAIIMFFLNVEKHLPVIHEKLNEKRKAEAEARGEVYVSQEELAAQEEAEKKQRAEAKRAARKGR
ncbi:MAG: MFS transporter, partial [Blautia sp.]|nr:MFS transporter [Blautia sp.]